MKANKFLKLTASGHKKNGWIFRNPFKKPAMRRKKLKGQAISIISVMLRILTLLTLPFLNRIKLRRTTLKL